MPSLPDRPEVLTDAVQRELIELIGDGNYLDTACLAAGTSRQTVEYWQKLCSEGVEHAQKYVDFFASLEKAKALAESGALREIRRGVDAWQSRAWFLERRYPKKWGRAATEADAPPAEQEKRIKLPSVDVRHTTRIRDGSPENGDRVRDDPEGTPDRGSGRVHRSGDADL